MQEFPHPASIGAAHDLFLSHFKPSPVLELKPTPEGGRMIVKLESELESIRAFKIRGALNALANLSESKRAKGVITHSSGNHGAALALAAQIFDVPCDIVLPKDVLPAKLENVKKFGARVHFCGTAPNARETMARQLQPETQAHFVHPYADLDVITGQATAAKEFLEQRSDLDQLVVPVGGGGLLTGTLLSAAYFGPRALRVIGAEPANAAHIHDSLQAGKPLYNLNKRNNQTSADALKSRPEALVFELLQNMHPDMKQVTERILKYVEALDLLPDNNVEISSLVALTQGLIQSALSPKENIGVIVSGGNK